MNDVTLLILPEIQEFVDRGDKDGLREALSELHPADIADVISNLDEEHAVEAFRSLPKETKVRTFEHLEESDQLQMLRGLGRNAMIEIIEDMHADDRADFIQALPELSADSILPLLAQAERNEVSRLVAYDENTAGAVMTTEYASLSDKVTVGEALQRLRTIAPDTETIYYVFITDESRRLLGYTTLRELVLARPTQNIMELRRHPLLSLPVDTDKEDVARAFSKYDLIAMPIVDTENRLIGIVTHDDVIDVLEEEATEDAQRMGAVEPLDTPYMQIGFWNLAWRRGAWLMILFAATLFTGTALRFYEGMIEKILSLIFFLPVIIAAGGNSGSQSATLVIRAMAVGEITIRDWWRIARREALMGLTLGLLIGSMGFVVALSWDTTVMVSLSVGLTLVAMVLGGSLAGALLPLGFKLCHLDPGVASSPFIASVVDIGGIVIYLSIVQALVPIPA